VFVLPAAVAVCAAYNAYTATADIPAFGLAPGYFLFFINSYSPVFLPENQVAYF
jgi:hypothetical protein